MDIGTKIKRHRKEAGLTQIELAQKAGIAVNSIRLYEGHKRIPNLETVQKIADSLDLDIRELLHDDNDRIREYEELQSVLETAGIAIEEAGFSAAPGEENHFFYVWLKSREEEDDFCPDEEKERYTYSELKNLVYSVIKDAETNKQRYIKWRLEKELFRMGWAAFADQKEDD